MRGSAVAKGLKSITDKLHPQLPLTSRESQQLLTALTTSFRRHLDEVHPAEIYESHRNANSRIKPKTNVRKVQSSAAYADRHLASVLTNSLFAKPNLEFDNKSIYEEAKSILTQDPSRDPISILEECDEKGTATLSIAELCLETLKQSFVVRDNERTSKLNELAPGRRVLVWLLQNHLHVTQLFAKSKRLRDLLCYFLIHEGHESSIWSWLRLDHISKCSEVETAKNERQRKTRQYWWRGKVLESLIRVKLGILDSDKQGMSVESNHSAMDAFFVAFETKQTAKPDHHLHWIPLTTAIWNIQPYLMAQFPGRDSLDVERYDRFVSAVKMIAPGSLVTQSIAASLQLRHPQRPSVDFAWKVAKHIFSPDPALDAQDILRSIEKDELHPKSQHWHEFLVLIMSRLIAENRLDESSWIKSVLADKFPSSVKTLQTDLAMQDRRGLLPLQKKVGHKQHLKDGLEIHDGVFIPSFG